MKPEQQTSLSKTLQETFHWKALTKAAQFIFILETATFERKITSPITSHCI
jgi:hypothetical protein